MRESVHFGALFQILSNYLTRNRDRELTIERGDLKLHIKGHSLPEEKALMDALHLITDNGHVV